MNSSDPSGFVRRHFVRSLTLAALAAGPVLAAPHGDPSPTLEPARAPLQFRLIEEFHAVGAEPAFWATMVKSDLERAPEPDGRVGFTFQMSELEAVFAGEEPLRFLPSEGVKPMVLRQDPATQRVSFQGEQATERFINETLEDLGGDVERGRTWTETVRLFDDSIVPGHPEVTTDVRFEAEPLPVGRVVFSLMRFESVPVSFPVIGGDVELRYTGLGLVDPEQGLVYHMVFRQEGKVNTGDGETLVSHVYLLSLLDPGDQPLVPLEGMLLDLVNEYVMKPRPDGVVDPAVLDLEPRPLWSTGVWLSGRIASAVMGLVAEQGTNPMPLVSVGSLVLSDEALGFAGNLYLDDIQVRDGLKDESERFPPGDTFRSPRDRIYGAEGEGDDDDRGGLLGPSTKGVLIIGKREIAFGVTAATAALLVNSSGGSSLGFATGSGAVPAGSASAAASAGAASAGAGGAAAAGATIAGVSTTTAVAVGAVAVGGGVAAASSSGSSGGGTPASVQLTFVESLNGLGFFTGTVTATITNGNPGDALMIRGTGTVIRGLTTVWDETASATVDQSGQASAQIPLIEHECIDGSIAVTINGQPATIAVQGSTFTSPFSDPCF